MIKRKQMLRGLMLLFLGVSLAVGLAAAHAHVIRQGLDYTGPLLVVDHLFDLVATLGLVAICTGLGRLTLNRLRVEFGDPLNDLLFATAIGAGLLSTVLLVLGLLGGFEPWIIGAVVLAVAALSWRELLGVPALAGAAMGSLKRRNGERVFWLFGFAVFAVVVVIMLVLAVAPPVDWDALMYHLRIPNQYLEAGRIYLPEDNLLASYIGPIHLLYVPLLAVGSIAGPAILSVIFAAMLGLAVYSLCAQLLDEKTAGLSLGLLWGSAMLILVAISPRVDVTVAFYLFLALYAVLLAFVRSPARPFLLTAAALLGFAVGIKYTAFPYVAGLVPIVVWAAVEREPSLTGSLRTLASFGLVFAAAALPWLTKNWLLLGAPLYPFFAESQLSPWLLPLYGDVVYPGQAGASLLRAVYPGIIGENMLQNIWEMRAPLNFLDGFFAPANLTLESEGFLYFLNPAFLILPLGLLFIGRSTLTRLVIPALIYMLAFLVGPNDPNLRFLIPAVPPLTIAVAYTMARLSERSPSAAAGRRLSVVLAFLALGPTIAASYLTLRSQAFPHLVGMSSASDYIASRIPGVYVDAVEYANSELPPDSRLLMLFDARGYYFEPPVIQDNLYRNWALLSAKLQHGSCLDPLGITHVLLHASSVSWFVEQVGVGWERLNWTAFEEFEGRCLEPLYENPSFTLYRVREQPAMLSAERSGR